MKRTQILRYLKLRGDEQNKLHAKAAAIRDKMMSKKVHFRGLIEFSNICRNDCLYCGIRRSNNKVKRYIATKKEILDCVKWCDKNGYESVVLQSGEVQTKVFLDFVDGCCGWSFFLSPFTYSLAIIDACCF